MFVRVTEFREDPDGACSMNSRQESWSFLWWLQRKRHRPLVFARRDALESYAHVAVGGIQQAQAKADTGYFAATCGREVDEAEARAIETAFLKSYRWQYIHSGAKHPHFGKVLSSLITENQGQRIQAALATLQ